MIGTVDAAPIGIELAYRMAGVVLDVVRDHPSRPILLLVDTQGQRLSHRDELLGINGYMAHLAKCLTLARARGHRVLGLVYSQAVSGGFLASSMLADVCYALPEAEIRVMNLPAMARVTKIPLERLQELSKASTGIRSGCRELCPDGRDRGGLGWRCFPASGGCAGWIGHRGQPSRPG